MWAWSKLVASTSLASYLKGFPLKIWELAGLPVLPKPELPPQVLTSVHWL